MKRFPAVFLLMVYGFTSLGASVTVHQCNTKQETTHHHKENHSHSSSSCSHQAAHNTPDCSSGNVDTCTAKTDDTVTEPVVSKPLNLQPVFFETYYADGSSLPVAQRDITQPLAQTSSVLHKLRLHLHNCILLI